MAESIESVRCRDIPAVYVNDQRNRWDADAPAPRSARGPGALLRDPFGD